MLEYRFGARPSLGYFRQLAFGWNSLNTNQGVKRTVSLHYIVMVCLWGMSLITSAHADPSPIIRSRQGESVGVVCSSTSRLPRTVYMSSCHFLRLPRKLVSCILRRLWKVLLLLSSRVSCSIHRRDCIPSLPILGCFLSLLVLKPTMDRLISFITVQLK